MKETLKKIKEKIPLTTDEALILTLPILAGTIGFIILMLAINNYVMESENGWLQLIWFVIIITPFILMYRAAKKPHKETIKEQYERERAIIIQEIKKEIKNRIRHLILDPSVSYYKVIEEKRDFTKDRVLGDTIPNARDEEIMNIYKSQFDPENINSYRYSELIHPCGIYRLTYAEMCMISQFEKSHPDLTVYHVVSDKTTKTPIEVQKCVGLDEYVTLKKKFITKIYALLYYKNDVSRLEGDAAEWDEFHESLNAGYAKAFIFEYGKMDEGKFCDLEVLTNKHALSFRNCIDPEDKDNASYTNRMIIARIKDVLYRYAISDSSLRKLTETEEQAYNEYLKTKRFYTLEEANNIYDKYEDEIGDTKYNVSYGSAEGDIIADIHNLMKSRMDIKCEYIPKIRYTNMNKCSTLRSKLEKSCEIGFDEADYKEL